MAVLKGGLPPPPSFLIKRRDPLAPLDNMFYSMFSVSLGFRVFFGLSLGFCCLFVVKKTSSAFAAELCCFDHVWEHIPDGVYECLSGGCKKRFVSSGAFRAHCAARGPQCEKLLRFSHV